MDVHVPYFFFNDTAPTEIYTLSLHDALPICNHRRSLEIHPEAAVMLGRSGEKLRRQHQDRKSTRLNSSHMSISYAVFCLKKKIDVNAKHERACAERR